jgi:HSP20 family protein
MPLRGESLRELVHLKRRMNQLFDEMLLPDQTPQVLPEFAWTPVADVYEDEAHYYTEVELPGVSIQDVEVTADQGLLKVSGERKPQKEMTREGVQRMERYFGRFLREFAFPEPLDSDKVHASLADGLLLIKIPKRNIRRSVRVE